MTNTNITAYSEVYIEKIFYEWFKAGAPHFNNSRGRELVKNLPLDEDGKRPLPATIRAWIDKYGWQERADILDAKLSLKMDDDAIAKKAELYQEIADIGKSTMMKGYAFISSGSFDTSAAALRAIFGGSELVAKFGNAADVLLSVGQMSDVQVQREILRLSGKDENEITVEAEDVEEDADTEDDNS